jgi:hypothetical protein
MPLDQAQKARVGSLLVGLLKGSVDLGIASLPLLSLYKQAKDEKVPFFDLVIASPEATAGLMDAMKRQAKKLPPTVILAMEEIIRSAKE